jgi:hypothetical protein
MHEQDHAIDRHSDRERREAGSEAGEKSPTLRSKLSDWFVVAFLLYIVVAGYAFRMLVGLVLLLQLIIFIFDNTVLRLVNWLYSLGKRWLLARGVSVGASSLIGDDDVLSPIEGIATIPPGNEACRLVAIEEETEQSMLTTSRVLSSTQLSKVYGSVELDVATGEMVVRLPSFRELMEDPFLVHCQYYTQPRIISTVAALIVGTTVMPGDSAGPS